jgi:hypothetical protein
MQSGPMIQWPDLPADSNRRLLTSEHVTIFLNEAADRLAIRELIESYAHCADRRDANGPMSLFTADTHFVVYMKRQGGEDLRSCICTRGLAPVKARENGQELLEILGR